MKKVQYLSKGYDWPKVHKHVTFKGTVGQFLSQLNTWAILAEREPELTVCEFAH